MRTVELFAGTGSFSKVAKNRGFNTFTVDIDPTTAPDIVADLRKFCEYPEIRDQISNANIVWMSPPCTTFSMAAGNKHWTADRIPKTDDAIDGLKLLTLCKEIADYCNETGAVYFIENPRARARWFMPEDTRHTVWYCQYGDNRAKPTDIWTNMLNWQPKKCRNGNPHCHHDRAPRGSRTGTQGMSTVERGAVPRLLIEGILNCYMRGVRI